MLDFYSILVQFMVFAFVILFSIVVTIAVARLVKNDFSIRRIKQKRIEKREDL